MCNLSKGVWEKGWNEGWKKGAEEAMLDSIKTVMETMSFTAEQAMTALKVPEAPGIWTRSTARNNTA